MPPMVHDFVIDLVIALAIVLPVLYVVAKRNHKTPPTRVTKRTDRSLTWEEWRKRPESKIK